jgi:hypothetical protein
MEARQSQRRLAIIVSVGLCVGWATLIVGFLDPRGIWFRDFFGPGEDGSWIASTIDGHTLGEQRLTLTVDGGEPVAGDDGCNSWSQVTREGRRGISKTLVWCSPDKRRAAYRELVFGKHTMTVDRDGDLILTGHNHHARFRAQED